jgi:hypothetical protein
MFGEAIEAVRAGDVDRIIHWPQVEDLDDLEGSGERLAAVHAFVTPQPEQEQAS